MKLVWSPKFMRAAKKLARRKPERLDAMGAALKQLESVPFHPSLRTHKLSGDFDLETGVGTAKYAKHANKEPIGENALFTCRVNAFFNQCPSVFAYLACFAV